MFSTSFQKLIKYRVSFKKICPVGNDLLHTDGHTGKHGEANFTFTGPCIANIFAEYNQQDATFSIYLFL